MKKNPNSQSGVFAPRVLLALAICLAGVSMAMLGFAATPSSAMTGSDTNALPPNGVSADSSARRHFQATVINAGPYYRPGKTERASLTNSGGEGNSDNYFPAVSGDGRIVSFTSGSSNLVDLPSSNFLETYVRDRVAGTTERVSVAPGGVVGNGASLFITISADGRFALFQSAASNLVPNDTNGATQADDWFVRDRATGVTERVNVASDGTQATGATMPAPNVPDISADGRVAAFQDFATNLVPGDTNGTADIFVRDRATGITERVSVASDGTQANGYSVFPSISADGRFVAFMSQATNLVLGGGSLLGAVYVRDRVAGTTEQVDVANDGAEPIGGNGLNQFSPAISDDGRFVAFDSSAINMVPGDSNGNTDMFVRDRTTGTTERVSVASDGTEGNGLSARADISADGRYVTFTSSASNLVPGDTNGTGDVFVHDRLTRTTERSSVATDGTEAKALDGLGGDSGQSRISADGRLVVFRSVASNLLPDDTNRQPDIFLRDRGPVVGILKSELTVLGCNVSVSGQATFSGKVAAVVDSASDGAAAELTAASLVYRPELGDLLLRLNLLAGPPAAPPGSPGILYGLRFTLAETQYEIRASREGIPSFALYRCTDLICTQIATLSGGLGTTGWEVLVSLPLQTLGTAEGASLTGLQAFTANGSTTAGAGATLDEVALPDVQTVRTVMLGIAPTGTPEEQVAFDTPASLAAGNFSGTLDVSSLSPGDYDVWARACLGATCGPAISSPLTACSPVQPVSVVSRKTHGSIGTFDIDLPLTGDPGIECRTGGATNDYQIIVTFPSAVTFSSASVTSGNGSVSSTSGNGAAEVIVNLTGVTNAQTITLTLSGVNDDTNTGDVAVRMGVLVGDTTANGAVNSSDIGQTKSRSGQTLSELNFRGDVTADGAINSSDISLVKSKSGTALP